MAFIDSTEFTEPEEEDIGIEDKPFDKYQVGTFGGAGKFIGAFTEYSDAIKAVRDYMERHQFWPNVWFVSDHGNTSLIDMSNP